MGGECFFDNSEEEDEEQFFDDLDGDEDEE